MITRLCGIINIIMVHQESKCMITRLGGLSNIKGSNYTFQSGDYYDYTWAQANVLQFGEVRINAYFLPA